jgi:hypothetical protein
MALRLSTIAILLAAVALAACNDGGDGNNAGTPGRVTPLVVVPGADDRVTLRGTLTLDGAPLVAEFLGVRVVRDGLPAACQFSIPTVAQGQYEIMVVADAEARGCGAPDAGIMLWTFANDEFLFSHETLPWPGGGEEAAFNATFSSATPGGASTPVTQLKGRLLAGDGSPLPSGTDIEAYAGDVLCGVASLRYGIDFDRLYTLIVAGPEGIPACAEGATLTFTLDGAPAVETAVNDLDSSGEGTELDLTLQ